MKKAFVMVVLFILPLVAYLFFASGVNNFGKLPVLTENVMDVNTFSDSVQFRNKITILGFLGYDVDLKKGNVFNLNQKIYKPFYEFNEFQMVMLVPNGSEKQVQALLTDLSKFTDTSNWKFVYASPQEIRTLFQSLNTDLVLEADLSSPHVFIIDKERRLRGRIDDPDEGKKFGFNATSVADLNNKMEDDVKIILAEYRLALKSNKADRNTE